MTQKRQLRTIAIGFALFSMFFGSGNLIFPLAIGLNSADQWTWAATGFLLSGVLLPFIGIIAMVVFKGNYEKFFGSMGSLPGFLFTAALLTAWIPLGSGPRCVVLSYANILPYLGGLPLWVYSFAYCLILYLVTIKKNRALDLLGYVLTPLLLVSLGCVIYLGLSNSTGYVGTDNSISQVFWNGLVEGYQTQDLIASFFFASAIIGIISKSVGENEDPVKLACRASVIGITILAAVYMGLIVLAASNGDLLQGVSKDALLATLVTTLMPAKAAFIGSAAVALACMTTSIALTLVFAEFLQNGVCGGRLSEFKAITTTVCMTFGMSLLGFDGITAIISPLMQIFYPALIALILWNLAPKLVTRRAQSQSEAV